MSHSSDQEDKRKAKEAKEEAIHYTDVVRAFQSYLKHSFATFDLMEEKWSSIDPQLSALLPGVLGKFKAMRAAAQQNAKFIQLIVEQKDIFHNSPDINYAQLEEERKAFTPTESNMSKVRSTIKQCARDWSDEGAAERAECYGPIIQELERLYPKNTIDRLQVKVLVPGSGLGRLAWDIANIGFASQGNEFSYFMLLCSYIILNCTSKPRQYAVFPFVHQTTNVDRVEHQLRPVHFPDVSPTSLPKDNDFSMVAGDFLEVYGAGRDKAMSVITTAQPNTQSHDQYMREHALYHQHQHDNENKQDHQHQHQQHDHTVMGSSSVSTTATSKIYRTPVAADYAQAGTWDCVATCYFLDTANNILEYIRTIAYILKPGGYWINFGPLLYHFADMDDEMSIELSYQEIKAVLPRFGLKMLREKTNISSHYTHNRLSMLNMTYQCVFFTCIKEGPMTLPSVQNIIDNSSNNSSANSSNTSDSSQNSTLSSSQKKKKRRKNRKKTQEQQQSPPSPSQQQ